MPRALVILLDLAVVCVFAAVGRAAHSEGLGASDWLKTAAPFLAATLLAWIALTLRPLADGPWRQGALVWAVTLGLGMTFRVLVKDGVQPAFVVVAALALAAGFFGWRGLAWLLARAGARR